MVHHLHKNDVPLIDLCIVPYNICGDSGGSGPNWSWIFGLIDLPVDIIAFKYFNGIVPIHDLH